MFKQDFHCGASEFFLIDNKLVKDTSDKLLEKSRPTLKAIDDNKKKVHMITSEHGEDEPPKATTELNSNLFAGITRSKKAHGFFGNKEKWDPDPIVTVKSILFYVTNKKMILEVDLTSILTQKRFTYVLTD